MNINEALATLDQSDDAHWTADGMPRMDVLQTLTQSPDLTRKEVTNAAPDFTRASAKAANDALPTEADNVSSHSKTDEKAEAPEDDEGVTAEADVMVEAVEPDVVAAEAPTDETATEAGKQTVIATSAPEKPVTAPTTKLEALQAALAVHTNAMNKADSIKKDAITAFNSASDQVNTLNRQIETIVKADPHAATAGIRDYIKMQNKIRHDKAARAAAFLGNSGAKPGDIAKALEVRSNLDKAFLGRKPPRGSVRPTVRTPQG